MTAVLEVGDPASADLSADRLGRSGPYFRAKYVDTGLLPGVLTLVARRGTVVHLECSGRRDVEAGIPVTGGTTASPPMCVVA